MKYDKNWLIEKSSRKEKIKFLFFWGHQSAKDGSVTQSCFSQWWVAPFIINGVAYRTAEHWMMAEKARLFNDNDVAQKVLKIPSPAEAKKLGRLVKNFNPAIWDKSKVEIVVKGNEQKFLQHQSLKEFLLNTGNKILVEASPVDNIWGIGLAADNKAVNNPLLWRGENLLGFALMEVRDKLKNNE